MFDFDWRVAGALALLVTGCGSVADERRAETEPGRAPADPTPLMPVRHAPSEPVAAPPSLSAAPPAVSPPSIELPYCAGKGTTWIRIQANVDAAATVPALAWNVSDPANTSNFSTTIGVYTADGSVHTLDLYFVKEADDRWGYHALGSAPIELGSGQLEFDDRGALQHHRAIEPLNLVGLHGFEPIAISFGTPLDEGGSGLDGLLQLEGPSNVDFQDQDGFAATVGSSCPNGQKPPEAAPRPSNAAEQALLTRFGMCSAAATRHLWVRANLARKVLPVGVGWEPKNPINTSNFSGGFVAYDERGRSVKLGLYFSKLADRVWDYHVSLLFNGSPGPELASGTLAFDEQGELARFIERAPLYLPKPDGTRGTRIELDFGDGLTSFEAKSSLSSISNDGHGLAFGTACSETDARLYGDWRWFPTFGAWGPWTGNDCGSASSYFELSTLVDPVAPVDPLPWDIEAPPRAGEIRISRYLYDANASPVRVEARLRHPSDSVWEVRVVTSSVQPTRELAAYWVYFDGSAASPIRVDGNDEFRLPSSDGSLGPPIRITGQIGQVPGGSNYIDLNSDGSPMWCGES